MHATARFVRISPRKVSQVLDLVRGKNAAEALNILEFLPKKAAGIIKKVVKSALANAKQKGEKLENKELFIVKACADGGPVAPFTIRYMPKAMGRAGGLRKRTSHIYIELGKTLKIKGGKKS